MDYKVHHGTDSNNKKKITLLCINVIFSFAGISIIAPVLPDIQAWGNLSIIQVGFIVSSFSLARIVSAIPAGYLCDKYRGNNIIALGMTTLCIGSIICGVATSITILVTGRIITGAGSAIAVTSIEAKLLRLANTDNRASVMSYFYVARRAGASIFPLIGGVVAFYFEWRSVFIFCAILNLIGIFIAIAPSRNIDRSDDANTEKPTLMNEVAQDETNNPPTKLESGFKMNTSTVFALNIFVFGYFLNRIGIEKTVLPLFGNIIGLNSIQIGITFTIAGLISLVAISGCSKLTKHFNCKRLLQVGLVVVIISNGLFFFVSNFNGFLIANLLFSLSAYSMVIPSIIISESVDPSMIGRALGSIKLFTDVGFMLGPIVLGWAMGSYGFVAAILFAMAILLLCLLIISVFLKTPSAITLYKNSDHTLV